MVTLWLMQLLLLLLFVFTELAGMRDIAWDKILEFLIFSDFPSAMGMFNIKLGLISWIAGDMYRIEVTYWKYVICTFYCWGKEFMMHAF